jgi:predicted nucleic acid-binding protein
VALTVLDSSVLIALLDPADRHHEAAGAGLEAHADDDLRLPAHALAEALVHPARAGKEREARRLIEGLELAVEPIDEQVVIAAARLRARHGGALRLPDALVLACAEVRKATTVLTADARWPAWGRRVEVVGT